MKLEVKIENGKFVYSYDISECSKQNGEMPITAEGLCLFTSLLKACAAHSTHKNDDFFKDVECRAWIEKNPEKYKEMLSKLKDAKE